MTTITRHSVQALRVMTLAIAIVAAPAWAILENPGAAVATPTASTQPVGGAEASTSAGSHKHLGTEQHLYGEGLVLVPHVDTTVHQSR